MKLPVVSGKELLKFLSKRGFQVVGNKGSHVRMKKFVNGKVFVTVVPMHKRIDPGTLLSILKQCELEKKDLEEL